MSIVAIPVIVDEDVNLRPTAEEWPLLDVLRGHRFDAGKGTSRPGDPGWSICSCGAEMYWSGYQGHVARHLAIVVARLMGEERERLALAIEAIEFDSTHRDQIKIGQSMAASLVREIDTLKDPK